MEKKATKEYEADFGKVFLFSVAFMMGITLGIVSAKQTYEIAYYTIGFFILLSILELIKERIK